MRCQLSFYCCPEDSYHQKYGLSRTHSAVIDALRHLGSGKALDLGRGRNARYLHRKVWNVTAWDKHPESIRALNDIIEQEHLEGIRASAHDIHLADRGDAYDMIVSTVVFVCLERSRRPAIIQKMQQQTVAGGKT